MKYRSLPGHGSSLAEFDHYVIVTGLAGSDFIYNDAAFATDYGFNLLISPEDLERAWSFSSMPRHAMAIGLNDSLRPLPNVPSSLTAGSLALGSDAEGVAGPLSLGMSPGPATQWLRERMLAEAGTGLTASAPTETSARPVETASLSQPLEVVIAVAEPADAVATGPTVVTDEAPFDQAAVDVVRAVGPAAGPATQPATRGSPPGIVYLVLLIVLGAAARPYLHRRLRPDRVRS